MSKNKKYIFFFIVIISFLLLAFMLQVMSWNGVYTHTKLLSNFFFNLPGWLLIGVIDFTIIHVSFKKTKRKKSFVGITADLLLCNFLIILISTSVNYFIIPAEINDYIIKYTIPIVIWNSIIVLLIEIFLYNQRQREAEKKIAIAEKEKIQYRYERLKTQINPHFLFNSLNVLSSLTYQDAEKANLFAKKMSGVYRYLLMTNARPIVTLQEEIAFLRSYIFLEQIRFEDALIVEIRNEDLFQDKKVIPVCTQLLVENAIKHNSTTTEDPLVIQINITDKCILVSNNLQLRDSVDKSGVGLENLQKQYALYDKKIVVKQTATEFTVELPYIDQDPERSFK